MRHRLAVAFAAVLMLARPASADTRTVTVADDSGAGSLRQAITDANASGDTIVFDPALAYRTITLTSAQLQIGKSLTITTDQHVTISGNRVLRVFNVLSGATVTIAGLTIRDGAAAGGAGIANAGTLTLNDVTVTENRSTSGGGGGIHNEGVLTSARTTVSYNVAVGGSGGGIDNVLGGDAVLTNCTVSGNVADGDGGGIEDSGAGSTLALHFVTVAFNRAGGAAGGIKNAANPADVTFESTILWGNGALTSGPNCSGTLTSGDYDLVGDASGCTIAGTTTHNRSGDPHLGALQHNGGAVATHPLRAGSDAMDQVPLASCASAGSFDARHISRPRDGNGTGTGSPNCDIGAYEAAKPIVVDSLDDFVTGNNCPLRYALTAAEGTTPFFGCAGGDPDNNRITFSVTGRIRMEFSQLTPMASVLIEGPGADLLAISGEGKTGVIAFNTASGIGAYGLSGVTITNGNGSSYGGVDAFNTPGTIAIDRVAFEDNVSKFNYGGSIDLYGAKSVEIDASSFRSTAAASPGASVYVQDSHTTIRSSTVAETRSDGAVQVNGTIFQAAGQQAQLRLIGCTIRGTESFGVMATTQDTPDLAVLEIQASVIDGHGADVADAGLDQATIVSRGDNVIGDASGPPLQTGDVNNALATIKLGDLLFGGGATKTMAPLPGSVLIDHIPLNRCPGTLDQRGVPRPLDGDRSTTFECDAGAFETAPPIVVNSLLDVADPGKCRLRDAVAAASTNAPVNGCAAGISDAPDLITFSVNGTINLASSLAPIGGLAVRGPGATKLTLNGQGAARIFDLTALPGGDYTLTGLTIANGHADFGGGVDAANAHTTALSGVTMRNNLATSDGGALYAQNGSVQLSRSAFTNPSGSSANFLRFVNAFAEVENSSVNDNSSPAALSIAANGAGAYAYLRMKSSTFSGTAPVGIQAAASGGAPASNALAEYGTSIVQGHAASFSLASGTGVSYGYNLASDASGTGLGGTGDMPAANAHLGPLNYHGGETPVFNLALASPAREHVPVAACGPVIDQRGYPRPYDTACDSGAVERRPGGDVSGDGNLDVADVFYLINFLFASGPVPLGEGDMNGDGAVDVADVFYLINRLFAGGPAPV